MTNKVKLFTHDDLDGVGCRIIAEQYHVYEKVEVEHLGNNEVESRIKEFIEKQEYEQYKAVYITDLSISEELAVIINSVNEDSKIRLFDHHDSSLHLDKYDWALVTKVNNKGKLTSATEILFNYFYPDALLKFNRNLLWCFAKYVTLYDTWRWKNEEGGDIAKQLNDLYWYHGIEDFIRLVEELITLQSSYSRGLYEIPPHLLAPLETLQKEYQKLLQRKLDEVVEVKIDGINFGYVFNETNQSELGNDIALHNDRLDAIIIANISKSRVSLRSNKDNINLSEFAAKYGGGGHQKAAGINFANQVELMKFLKIIWGTGFAVGNEYW